MRLTHRTNRGPAQSVPAWVAALGVGEWGELAGSNISAVEPSPLPAGNGPVSKIIAWTSFVAIGNKVYSVANGGHNDYSGNEVDVIDLNVASPAWTELLAPTPAGSVVAGTAFYGDNRPTSRHTYYGVTYNPVDDRIMLIGGAGWGDPSPNILELQSYNVASNSYNGSGTHPVQPGTGNYYGECCCADPVTGDIYRAGSWSLYKWTRATNTWSLVNGSAPYGDEAASAWDTTRNRMFILPTSQDPDGYIYTPGTNTLNTQALSGAGAAACTSAGLGMCYVASIDKFLVRRGQDSGATVYQIDPVTFEATVFAVTGGGTIPQLHSEGRCYNKFLSLDALGVVVYFPSYTGNAWALRVS